MTDPDVYKRLVQAQDDLELWRRLAPLLQFGVFRDHIAEKAAARAEEAAMARARAARIPQQRRPVDLWPVPRSGDSRRIQLPRRPR